MVGLNRGGGGTRRGSQDEARAPSQKTDEELQNTGRREEKKVGEEEWKEDHFL